MFEQHKTKVGLVKITFVYQSDSLIAQEISWKLEQKNSFWEICESFFQNSLLIIHTRNCRLRMCMVVQKKVWMPYFLFKKFLSFFTWFTCNPKSNRTNTNIWTKYGDFTFTHISCFTTFRKARCSGGWEQNKTMNYLHDKDEKEDEGRQIKTKAIWW